MVQYNQKKIQGINKYLQDYKERLSPRSKSQLADIILHPDASVHKIERDLRYYENLLHVESEVMEKLFSGYEFYHDLNTFFSAFSQFKILGIAENDTNKVALLKASEELALDTEGQERCSIGQ